MLSNAKLTVGDLRETIQSKNTVPGSKWMCDIIPFPRKARISELTAADQKAELRHRLDQIISEIVELWSDNQHKAVAALGIRLFDHLDIDYLIPGIRTMEVIEGVDWEWLTKVDETLRAY
jgi:hypothetical protein